MENGTTTNYSISGQITCLTIQINGIQNWQRYQHIQITTLDQNRMKYSNWGKKDDMSITVLNPKLKTKTRGVNQYMSIHQ